MILISHPTGNTFFRAASRAFHNNHILAELASCICWNPSSTLSTFIPESLRVQLNRRSFKDIPLSQQHSYPYRDLLRLITSRSHISWLHKHEIGYLSIDSIYRSFDKHIASYLPRIPHLRGVYAYEDSALATFKAAKKLNLACFYDLPIGYWQAAQAIFYEEKELMPNWACTLTGLNDSLYKLQRKDEELALSDVVIVPSIFVKSTLENYNAPKAVVEVVPFGSPPPIYSQKLCSTKGPLRILYVGSLGQRKGLSYALSAVDSLGSQVTLTLIGKRSVHDCKPLNAALEKHTWIETLPHSQILDHMAHHDVLLLPSLFEGYALVISEALSRGLPVITTPNSGALDIVRDGIEGFIIPIRDTLSISARLQLLIDDRQLLFSMSQNSLRRAIELSWPQYEHLISSIVLSHLNSNRVT